MEKNKIFVVNAGSSTVKLALFAIDKDKLTSIARLLFDKLGKEDSYLKLNLPNQAPITEKKPIKNVQEALLAAREILEKDGLLKAEELLAIGHRVVHGGSFIQKPVWIDEQIKEIIRKCFLYAPLHNPWNLEGIEACEKLFSVPQLAVFDTAFHTTIPDYAKTYALPGDLCKKYQIQRYGFHGTSHEYVARKACEKMGKDFSQWSGITLHLGNGASLCAIKKGQSVDTSMGFTPLEGLVMGTRCGDIDPALVVFLQEKENLTVDEIMALLNKKSGLLGICGKQDMREILELQQSGHAPAKLAVEVFVYRIRKYLGAYFFALSKPDAIVFTGGIGENSAYLRQRILGGLENFGILLNNEANASRENMLISQKESPVAVWVIPTDEEWVIAEKVGYILK